MLPRWITFPCFEPHREIGPLFIRLVIGWHLVYGTQDNVFSPARMAEFSDFLAQHGFAYPAFMAPLSAYAQFVCGLLYVAVHASGRRSHGVQLHCGAVDGAPRSAVSGERARVHHAVRVVVPAVSRARPLGARSTASLDVERPAVLKPTAVVDGVAKEVAQRLRWVPNPCDPVAQMDRAAVS
jgi:hypothetical protein